MYDRSGATRGSQRKVTNILYIGAQNHRRAVSQSAKKYGRTWICKTCAAASSEAFVRSKICLVICTRGSSTDPAARSRPLFRDLKPVCQADVPRCKGRLALLEIPRMGFGRAAPSSNDGLIPDSEWR